jgi:hypothetical protein
LFVIIVTRCVIGFCYIVLPIFTDAYYFVFQLLKKIVTAMAAIFADAVVFGYKALSKESSPSYDEQSVPLAVKAWDYWRPQVQNSTMTQKVWILLAGYIAVACTDYYSGAKLWP